MQLSIFDIETPTPQLACEKPTRKNPNGRTGTSAGVQAHYAAKEAPCDECAQYNRERAGSYYAEKREYVLEKKRSKYRQDPDKYLNYMRSNPADPVKAMKSKRAWEAKNVHKMRAYKRKYALNNPEVIARKEQRRRARLAGLPSETYTVADVARTYGSTCYLCFLPVDITMKSGSPTSPEIDHVIPIASDECPGDLLMNARITHSRCNRTKSDNLVKDLALPFPPPIAAITSSVQVSY